MQNSANTVYVVEDDEVLSRALTRSLRKRGFSVEEFRSAEAFLEGVDGTRSGCLVLDYGLPEMNGLELQSHLNEIGISIPIIFITGHGGIPESVKAMRAGAIDFLEKPYKTANLISRIETAFEKSREIIKDVEAKRFLKNAINSLTAREQQVFDLLINDPNMASSKAIARALDISPRTADIHRSRVLSKTGCVSVVDLVKKFSDLGSTT